MENRTESLYSKMESRINLQSIGYLIKEGSLQQIPDRTTFIERSHDAKKELEKALSDRFDKESVDFIEQVFIEYVAVKEEIQFSLGMKVGVKLALSLTNDFESDF